MCRFLAMLATRVCVGVVLVFDDGFVPAGRAKYCFWNRLAVSLGVFGGMYQVVLYRPTKYLAAVAL